MNMFKKGGMRGFTMVEILVAFAVIAILSTAAYTTLSSARARARDTERRSDIEQIRLALRLYVDANGSYPSVPGGEQITTGSTIGNLLEPYLAPLPVDPLGSGIGNAYVYDSDIKCAVEGSDPVPSHIMIYARQTEGSGAGNWATVCGTRNCGAASCGSLTQKGTLPAPAPNANSYGIILQ
jgi:prepilin-type N-terminal cleavage/methylation domain-containing protein